MLLTVWMVRDSEKMQRPCLTAWVELYNGNVRLAGRLIITNDGIPFDLQWSTVLQREDASIC